MLGQLNGKRGAGLGFPITNYSTPAQLGLVTWLQGCLRWRVVAVTDPKREESHDFSRVEDVKDAASFVRPAVTPVVENLVQLVTADPPQEPVVDRLA